MWYNLLMSNSTEIISTLSEVDIRNKIYTIRGVQVMLNSDLAEIYGYETNNFNRQVKTILKSLMKKILCFN